MLVLENASTGDWRYWKVPVLENVNTGVLPFNILVGCELVYSCSEKISLCWKWTERNLKSGGRLKGTQTAISA